MKTNIKQFLREFKAAQQKVLVASEKAVNSTLREMYKRIIDRTPVGKPELWSYPAGPDYTPGTLRDSWRLNFNGTLRNTRGQFASGAQISNSGGLKFRVNSSNSNQSATIFNPQVYAQRVENGWSTQAPRGMMRVTIAEYVGILNGQAAKYRVR